MIQSSFGRLERCWKTKSFVTQLKVTSCGIHNHQHQHKSYGSLLSHRLSTVQCRHASHIVKSPYKDIVIPNKLIQEMIWETVDRFPENTAIKCGLTSRAYTFAEIQKLSYRFANSLRKAGFTKGDVIAVVLPNCPEFAIITLGVLEAELSLTFINHGCTHDEILHQLKDSGCVCIVAATEKLSAVMSAVSTFEDKTQSTLIRRIIAVDIPSPESLPRGVVRFSEMISDSVDSSVRSLSRVRPDELAFLPYSSGTTGLPKGVCLSHRNIVTNILQTYEGWNIKPPDVKQNIFLGILPFYHIFGLVLLLLSPLVHGSQIVTLPKFDQDSFISTLQKEKFSVMLLVPPLILFLANSNKVLPEHLANVRFLGSGAAPLGDSDMENLKRKLNVQQSIFQGFGMTELSGVAILPLFPAKNLATIGVPITNTLAKVINPDTGESLGPHESGELCIKGPQVMLGYHNNSKATADMIDSEGWLRTGDVAYFEEDGHFYIKDRLKELIKVKGLQVAPAELEQVLRTHPYVEDTAVIGVPCERAGETPVAYIVPKKDKKLTADDVKTFLSEKISQHKLVSEVFFTNSIPKSASGKILRKVLKHMYVSSNRNLH